MTTTSVQPLGSAEAVHHRDAAAEGLVYYFALIARRAGVKWNGDNEVEVAAAVDDLARCIVAEVTYRIEQHADNAPHIYADGSAS